MSKGSEWPLVLKVGLGIGMVVGGMMKLLFPEFNGFFSGPVKTSLEHNELMGLISLIGGVIIFFMPTDLNSR